MKPAIKNLLTVIVLAAVLCSQALSVRANSSIGPTKTDLHKKSCCAQKVCATRCCVEQNSKPTSQAPPAVPVSSAAHNFQLALIPVLAWILPAGTPPANCISARSAPSVSASVVPLYKRTHSFLI